MPTTATYDLFGGNPVSVVFQGTLDGSVVPSPDWSTAQLSPGVALLPNSLNKGRLDFHHRAIRILSVKATAAPTLTIVYPDGSSIAAPSTPFILQPSCFLKLVGTGPVDVVATEKLVDDNL